MVKLTSTTTPFSEDPLIKLRKTRRPGLAEPGSSTFVSALQLASPALPLPLQLIEPLRKNAPHVINLHLNCPYLGN